MCAYKPSLSLLLQTHCVCRSGILYHCVEKLFAHQPSASFHVDSHLAQWHTAIWDSLYFLSRAPHSTKSHVRCWLWCWETENSPMVCAHKIHGVPSRVYTVKKKLLETHLYILFQCLPCVWFINRGGLPKGCALLFIIPTPLAAQGSLSLRLRTPHASYPSAGVFALFWLSPHALSSLFWFIIVIRVAIEVSLICICFAVTDLFRGCLFLRFGPLCASARVFKQPSIKFERYILTFNPNLYSNKSALCRVYNKLSMGLNRNVIAKSIKSLRNFDSIYWKAMMKIIK